MMFVRFPEIFGLPALSSANRTWFGTCWYVARPDTAGLLTGGADPPGVGSGLCVTAAGGVGTGLGVTIAGGVGVGPALGVTVDREMNISAIPTMTIKAINE